MKFKLKIPKFPKLPVSKLKKIRPKKIIPFFAQHKIATIISLFIFAFFAAAMWYRGNFISRMKAATTNTVSGILYSTSSENPVPTYVFPTAAEAEKTVLGTHDESSYSNDTSYVAPPPLPTLPPIPTSIPIPTVVTTTSSSNSSSGNNTGNPNCTSGSGEPNAWYSDVYPNPPISTSTGSVQLVVALRDCFKQTAPVNDTLSVSLVSGDPNTKVNGNSLPYTFSVQNGSANFEVSSQITGAVTLEVKDTTKGFTITDINNHNPTVTFSNNSTGNSNCTTGAGTANFWYSEVSPSSPVSASAGSSVTFNVDIKDCGKNNVSGAESLTISQTSSDGNLTVNGSALPVNIQTSNGHASFSVSSPNAGTVNLIVRDNTSSFNVTDANNHNPSVNFTGSSSPTATPEPTNTPAPNPTDTPVAATNTPVPSATSIPSSTNTPIPNPTGS